MKARLTSRNRQEKVLLYGQNDSIKAAIWSKIYKHSLINSSQALLNDLNRQFFSPNKIRLKKEGFFNENV